MANIRHFTLCLLVLVLVGLSCVAADYPMWAVLQKQMGGLNKYLPAKDATLGQFMVLNSGKDVFIPNLKRTKDSAILKLSIAGATVDKVINSRPNQWRWVLSDKIEVLFSMTPVTGASPSEVVKYSIFLPGGAPHREVCVHYGYRNASWFAGYQSLTGSNWPMNTSRILPREDFANVRNFSYDATREDFNLIMEQMFVNSDGFGVAFDSQQPLFMRRDPNHGEPQLCFSTNNSGPYDPTTKYPRYLDLKMHIFAGQNIRAVTDFIVSNSRLIPRPASLEIPDEAKFTHPTWSNEAIDFPAIRRSSVEDLAAKIVKHGFSPKSQIMLADYLQREYGNMELSPKYYPNPKEMVTALREKGFRIGMAAGPSSSKYRTNMQHNDKSTADFFIKNARDHDPTVLIDFSNPEACSWYEYLLRHAKYEYGIDAFQLGSTSIRWLVDFKDPQVHKYPGMISTKYVETAARLGNKLVSNVGYKTQHLPVFVRFSQHRYHSDYMQLLDALIPNALAVSMAGYSFFEPYQIGGFNRQAMPKEEIYIRWVQAVTFMPSMAFMHTPWSYQNANVTSITKKYVDLHAEHAPTLIALAKDRVRYGRPIIRPLWYVAPDDAATYRINDQFMVGDNILVAPVVKLGQRERQVYLPAGTWIDQHGQKYNGGSVVKIAVPLEELPYFKRQIKV